MTDWRAQLRQLYEYAKARPEWAYRKMLVMHLHQMGYAVPDEAQVLRIAEDILEEENESPANDPPGKHLVA